MEKPKLLVSASKFNVGDLVVHQRQGYRAVIIDVDPAFQPHGQYYVRSSERYLARRCPWYRLLVDECSQETYVEESLLQPDSGARIIDNPQTQHHLIFKQDKYHKIGAKH